MNVPSGSVRMPLPAAGSYGCGLMDTTSNCAPVSAGVCAIGAALQMIDAAKPTMPTRARRVMPSSCQNRSKR
jgi:hypothetical protein